jgi:hypothetical protein
MYELVLFAAEEAGGVEINLGVVALVVVGVIAAVLVLRRRS